MTQTIHPTHTCFDDAVEIVLGLVERDRTALTDPTVQIVHAIVAPEGRQLAHAWVEIQHGVLFYGVLEGQRQLFLGERDAYYQKLRIVESTRYTVLEACREEHRTGHCGPWKPEYRQLTSDGAKAS